MFDIGFAELLIVAVVALLVLGPEKLPTAVRTLGLWMGKFRRTVSGIQSEISEELRLDELRRNASIEKDRLEEELSEMKTPYQSAKPGASDAAPFGEAQAPSADAGAGGGAASRDKAES
uniref:Sec-independent protein translocase protein TatB n=1 Tax=Marinobacterium profundum TaxID=1714300 RepID=UPI0008312916|nr:Sec-independent protein translocase protein TatB [Marinobacterium profundum]